MKIKALISLAGKYNLNAGQVTEINDKKVVESWLEAGLVEKVEEAPKVEKKATRAPKKQVKKDEDK